MLPPGCQIYSEHNMAPAFHIHVFQFITSENKAFFLYFKFTRTHNSTIQKKSSKIQSQNKTQTSKKPYAFLNKACTRRKHININSKNNNNNNNNNNIGIISKDMYRFTENKKLLPQEQNGYRRKSRGTKDQVLIDKTILKD